MRVGRYSLHQASASIGLNVTNLEQARAGLSGSVSVEASYLPSLGSRLCPDGVFALQVRGNMLSILM
jgi:hypothetical protein